MAGSINVALQGLSAAMRGFETTSNNIANVNTPGYSRQQIELSARAAPEQGVQVLNVGRVVDVFATQQLWSSSAAFASSEAYAFAAGQIDDLLANPNTSISAATDQFFSALQTGVDDPASIPNRELILNQTEALARRFFEVDSQLRAQNQALNTKLQSAVSNVNEMAGQMASLNDLIRLADARGEPANELKDQRDQLVLAISEKIGGTIQTGTGSTDINLYVGNGQPLVIGGNASALFARQGDPDINDIEIFVDMNGKTINVSGQIREGEVGGMLDFKDDVMLPTWNELGRLAIVFADTMNQQQGKGLDLDGNIGRNLFSDPKNIGDVRSFSTNLTTLKSTSNVIIQDTSLLQASDYVVKFGEGDQFTVTRSDGQVLTQKDFAARSPGSGYQDGTVDKTAGHLRLNIDGIDITLDAENGLEFAKNDRVLIQPVRAGARSINVELTSGRELAFASPVRAETAIDNTGTVSIEATTIDNRKQLMAVPGSAPAAVVYFTDENTYAIYQDPGTTPLSLDLATAVPYVLAPPSTGITYREGDDIVVGGGTLSAVTITDTSLISDLLKTAPMQLVFGKNGTQDTYSVYRYDLATDPDQLNPIAVSLNNPYVEGQPIQLEGFEVTTRGKPQPGDKIDFGFNTDAVSDNRNALQLSNLQQQLLVDGGSFQDNYGRLVERVGSKASVAHINLEANETIMLSAESIRNGVSGVNLDEEAANLIKFQQQYQAASQVINTARELFQTLLSSTGG